MEQMYLKVMGKVKQTLQQLVETFRPRALQVSTSNTQHAYWESLPIITRWQQEMHSIPSTAPFWSFFVLFLELQLTSTFFNWPMTVSLRLLKSSKILSL